MQEPIPPSPDQSEHLVRPSRRTRRRASCPGVSAPFRAQPEPSGSASAAAAVTDCPSSQRHEQHGHDQRIASSPCPLAFTRAGTAPHWRVHQQQPVQPAPRFHRRRRPRLEPSSPAA
ncbi:unnamed protein product [Closterium sp. Yama58-4]|nr:unnamed protein product [Closterium sp. Yama58-4]